MSLFEEFTEPNNTAGGEKHKSGGAGILKRGEWVRRGVGGVFPVWIPAAAIAAYLSLAVPWPPLMMAPAWPMRRPGGAVWPAMKPTTGFFTLALMYSAA